MPRQIRYFYVTSARKFKLNNDLSCEDKKKNGRNLQTVCMFCAITSLLVKVRKSLQMAFKDDTSVENMRPFLRFCRSQNLSQILFEFGPFQGIFSMGENFEPNFFFRSHAWPKSLHMAFTVCCLRRLYAKFRVKRMVQIGRKMQL